VRNIWFLNIFQIHIRTLDYRSNFSSNFIVLFYHFFWVHKLSIINKIESERIRKISALPKDIRLNGRDCLTDLYETLFPKLELINTRSYWIHFLWNCNNNNKSSYSWEIMNDCLSVFIDNLWEIYDFLTFSRYTYGR
jgi:hypothetical protein